MEYLLKHLQEGLTTPSGALVSILVLISVVILVFLFLYFGGVINISRDENNKRKISFQFKRKQKKQPYVSDVNIRNLIDIIDTDYQLFLKDSQDLNEDFDEQVTETKRAAIERQISEINASFQNSFNLKNKNRLENQQILELYLQRDFSALFMKKLTSTYKAHSILSKTDIEYSNDIPKMTEELLSSMRRQINSYSLLSEHYTVLMDTFDTYTPKFSRTISDAINQFVKLSDQKKQKYLILENARKKRLSSKLEEILGAK